MLKEYYRKMRQAWLKYARSHKPEDYTLFLLAESNFYNVKKTQGV